MHPSMKETIRKYSYKEYLKLSDDEKWEIINAKNY